MKTHEFDNQTDLVEVLKQATNRPRGGSGFLLEAELVHRLTQADMDPEMALAALMKFDPELYSRALFSLQQSMGNAAVSALHERVSRQSLPSEIGRRVERGKEGTKRGEAVQHKLAGGFGGRGRSPDRARAAASQGVRGGGGALPGIERIQPSFGRHDLRHVRAHRGGDAARANRAMGSLAYTFGEQVAFVGSPSLHTAAHEAAHVIQQRYGALPSGGVGQAGDAFERHADAVADRVIQGRSAEGLLDQVRRMGRAGVAVQFQDDAATQGAKGRAQKIKEALLDGWTEDEEGALNQIRGQSSGAIQQIRSQYRSLTGRWLEADFKAYCNEKQTTEALGLIWPCLTLKEKIKANITEGVLWNTENEEGILDVLKNASESDLKAAAKDASLMKMIEGALSKEEMFKARKYLAVGDAREQEMFDAVIKRIKGAEGVLDDDEDAVWDALLDLTPEQRKTLWEKHEAIFSFLSAGEKKAVKTMCTGSEAEALKERMRLATSGAGTNDAAVGLVAQKTGQAARRESEVKQLLDRGLDEKGQPLSPERQKVLQGELSGLGGIQDNLLTSQNDGFNLKGGSFLEMLQGDVGDAEFQAFTQQMGVMPYERARRQILDAFGVFSDDEDKVYKAFEGLPPDLRQKLWADPYVAARLKVRLGKGEHDRAQESATGDSFVLARNNIRDAFYGLNTDETGVIKLVSNLSVADRETFKTDKLWTEIKASWSFNKKELDILTQLVEQGTFPRDQVLDYTLGKTVELRGRGGQKNTMVTGGTGDSEMFELWIGRLSDQEKADLRFGYWVARNGGKVEGDKAAKALAAFRDLERRMKVQFGTDEVQKHLDAILGPPQPADLQSAEGRRMAADIMASRIKDKQALQGSLGDGFTESDETADMASVQFMAMYRQLQEDGEISAQDLAVLGHLSQQYGERYDSYVQTLDAVAHIAGTVAAIAVGILVTVLSGGTAGPAVGAALAKFAVAGAVAGAIAKVGTAELIGGDHYDASRAEGAKDALSGAVDGAMAVLGAGLAHKFTGMVGLGQAQLATEMTAGIVQTTRGAASYVGRRMVSGGVEAAIDGFLSGAVGELVLTATDRATWEKGVWNAVTSMGLALLKGGALGAGTGMVLGGGLNAIGGAAQVSRVRQALGDMAGHLPAERLAKVSVEQADQIAAARKALLKGDTQGAEKTLAELGKSMDAEDLTRIRQGLFSAKSGDAIEKARHVIDARDAKLAQLLEGKAPDEPVVVDSIIVGSGWAGVADAKTHPLAGQVGDNGLPRVIGIAADADPWAARLERMGQSPDALNVPGFSSQAADFSPHADGFTPSQAFGAAVAENRADSGLSVWRRRITGARPAPEGSPGKIEVTVDLGGGQTRKIYTNQLDLALGPGPPKKLGGALTPEHEALLTQQGILVQGEHQLSQAFPDGDVLVYGGGATGAWNAELATRQGVNLDWVASSSQGGNRSKVAKIDAELRKPGLADDVKLRLLSERSALIKSTDPKDAFRGSNVPRNADILQKTESTRRVADILTVEPQIVDGKTRALVTYVDGSTRSYDRVVLNLGQDANAPGGVGFIAEKMGLQLEPIIKNGELLGVQSTDGSVRILGAAAAAQDGLIDHMSPTHRAMYMDLLEKRMYNTEVSPNSRGIAPAIEVWSDSFSKLNQADNAAGHIPGGSGSPDLSPSTTRGSTDLSPSTGKASPDLDQGAAALSNVGNRLKAGADLDPAQIDAWIGEHGLAKATEMMGDHLLDHSGLDLGAALQAMRNDPQSFYKTHGALVSSAVLRRVTELQQVNAAAAAALGVLPNTNLVTMADNLGFSMVTHFTPEARAGQIAQSGHIMPGKNSGGLIWGTSKHTLDAPTKAQSLSFADYGGNASEALPIALPKDMLIPPTHAFETHTLPQWLNQKAYFVKGKLQQAIGDAAGAPPIAINGPIQLLPEGLGMTADELASLQSRIAGTINTKGGEALKITFVVVSLTGSGAYLASVYIPKAKDKPAPQGDKKP